MGRVELERYIARKLTEIEEQIVRDGVDHNTTQFLRGRHAALVELTRDIARAENPVDNADEGEGVFPL